MGCRYASVVRRHAQSEQVWPDGSESSERRHARADIRAPPRPATLRRPRAAQRSTSRLSYAPKQQMQPPSGFRPRPWARGL